LGYIIGNGKYHLPLQLIQKCFCMPSIGILFTYGSHFGSNIFIIISFR